MRTYSCASTRGRVNRLGTSPHGLVKFILIYYLMFDFCGEWSAFHGNFEFFQSFLFAFLAEQDNYGRDDDKYRSEHQEDGVHAKGVAEHYADQHGGEHTTDAAKACGPAAAKCADGSRVLFGCVGVDDTPGAEVEETHGSPPQQKR